MSVSDPMHATAIAEAIKTNYNQTGVAIMQAMYSDEYLSLGGTASTDALAAAAGINAEHKVLDIGCGVGGPARRLAASLGCHVTGIDLVASSIDIAREQAERRGLEALTRFEVADATSLPFDAGVFDIVVGQDAWCHVPDKHALLGECARVLCPGGKVAFTDWLRLDDDIDEAMEIALEAALSKSAATHQEYLDILAARGFEDIATLDLSETFATAYEQICASLNARRVELSTAFSERVFDIVAGMNGRILAGFAQGKIGGARFVAVKS
ncbi:MAG: methyltransferase domain-containing protein [Pseudomonadota bacterium]